MRQRVKIVIKEEIVRELYAIAGEDAVQTAEPMKNHTTFRVGGPADYFVAPHTEEEIRKIVALCEEKEIPWFVTGNGSNLVVSDKGYHGVILSVYKNFQGIEVEGNRIRAKDGRIRLRAFLFALGLDTRPLGTARERRLRSRGRATTV